MSLDVLAFFAHPDDETMLCGGTLALLAAQGARVHLLLATRGEGGEVGEPPICTREQLAQVREDELRCAARALGAASLSLMDYIDPTVGPGEELYAFAGDVDEVAARVAQAARDVKAGALITHGVNGEYGHPAHMLAHRAAVIARRMLSPNVPLLYAAQASFPEHPHPRLANVDAPAHLVVDIQPVLQQKTDAALCHATQHALFVRQRSKEAGRQMTVPEVIHTLEGLHRVFPPFTEPGEIHDALADLLWASGSARGSARTVEAD
jgi:LmbE family N-acetylglucosaminyl deacetylase